MTPEQLETGTDLATALGLFDALPTLPTTALRGPWRGTEVPTGHPWQGLLGRLGWWGKEFVDDERVHPLVFSSPGGTRWYVDPARLPLRPLLAGAPAARRAPLLDKAFQTARPLLRTTRPAARLRVVEHRGSSGAAMVYDAQPIIDHFRALAPGVVLGVMDLRGAPPFVFLLRRA